MNRTDDDFIAFGVYLEVVHAMLNLTRLDSLDLLKGSCENKFVVNWRGNIKVLVNQDKVALLPTPETFAIIKLLMVICLHEQLLNLCFFVFSGFNDLIYQ